jgi:hypothetical protein
VINLKTYLLRGYPKSGYDSNADATGTIHTHFLLGEKALEKLAGVRGG